LHQLDGRLGHHELDNRLGHHELDDQLGHQAGQTQWSQGLFLQLTNARAGGWYRCISVLCLQTYSRCGDKGLFEGKSSGENSWKRFLRTYGRLCAACGLKHSVIEICNWFQMPKTCVTMNSYVKRAR
jgi:hypothetical protein